VEIQARYDARNPVALKQLVASGAKLQQFPIDMMNAAFKASNELYSEISGKNESFRKIYADMVKFRADENLWFRFTEMSFDRFMQSQKL
jgi:TRAP-type mannitol/chloroaromatic compound transport system substrate-binding protein